MQDKGFFSLIFKEQDYGYARTGFYELNEALMN